MTTSLPAACTLCNRDRTIGALCWRCHDHLADLLSDRPGTTWNPARPDDPYVPPGCRWFLAHVGDGQRATRPQYGAPSQAGFRSTSPADDTVIALGDPRSQPDDHMPWLAGLHWLSYTASQLAANDLEVADARKELRALQRALLGVVHDEHGPRWVGTCRTLVNADGVILTAAALAEARAQAPRHRDYAPWVFRCSTALWSRPTPPAGEDEQPPLPSVRCPSCRTVYGGLALAQMGRVLSEEVAA